jgi:hypothetical protein
MLTQLTLATYEWRKYRWLLMVALFIFSVVVLQCCGSTLDDIEREIEHWND